MTSFKIFANGPFWGIWEAETADDAIKAAALDVGTDGNTYGLTAEEVDCEQ